jgi:hypothetical protein
MSNIPLSIRIAMVVLALGVIAIGDWAGGWEW